MKHAISMMLCMWILTGFHYADSFNRWATNTKLMGISSHVDQDVFAHIGVVIDHDYYLTKNMIIRAGTGAYQDSYDLLAGFFHLGVRFEAQKFNNIYVRVGLGPTFIWRQNWWNHKPGYEGSTFFGQTKQTGDWETGFLMYGGDIEIEWQTDDHTGIVFTIVPAYPVVINTSFGIRWRPQ